MASSSGVGVSFAAREASLLGPDLWFFTWGRRSNKIHNVLRYHQQYLDAVLDHGQVVYKTYRASAGSTSGVLILQFLFFHLAAQVEQRRSCRGAERSSELAGIRASSGSSVEPRCAGNAADGRAASGRSQDFGATRRGDIRKIRGAPPKAVPMQTQSARGICRSCRLEGVDEVHDRVVPEEVHLRVDKYNSTQGPPPAFDGSPPVASCSKEGLW